MWMELVQEFHGKLGGISMITSICGGSLFMNSTGNMVVPLYVDGACSGVPQEVRWYLYDHLYMWRELVHEFHVKYGGTSICGGSLFGNSLENLVVSLGSPLCVDGACSGVPQEVRWYLYDHLYMWRELVHEFHGKYGGTSICGWSLFRSSMGS